MAFKSQRYRMGNNYGDLPKGRFVYLSLHHQPLLDGHRMVVIRECGQGAAYSVPEGVLIPAPYDEYDED